MLPIVLMAFVMGIFPGYFTDRIEPSVDRLQAIMDEEYDDWLFERQEAELIARELDEQAALTHTDLEGNR